MRQRQGRARSECIERPHPLRHGQIDQHDDDRHDGEGRGQRDVPGGALQLV